MPLHRHECESCGNRFRVLERPGVDEETPTCPVCGSTKSHRLMPLVAVQFKGSGFYRTDHGRKSRSRTERSGSDGDSKGDASTKSSGDSTDSAASASKTTDAS